MFSVVIVYDLKITSYNHSISYTCVGTGCLGKILKTSANKYTKRKYQNIKHNNLSSVYKGNKISY